jgi:hypothetical protein
MVLAAAKWEKNATTGCVERVCVVAVAAVALVLSSSGSILAAAVAALDGCTSMALV